MPATLRRLLADSTLRLRLLSPENTLPSGSLDGAVSWVHSSDLSDPTPFLAAGQLLLTTGSQFPGAGSDQTTGTHDAVVVAEQLRTSTDAFVSRLIAHGIVGLGFGTGVVHAETPAVLIEVCRAQGLPLFEVPYLTPFIAVTRLIAAILAEDEYARRVWALRAQNAISVAATCPDGLSAILAELAHQLDHWVALFDGSGSVDRILHPGPAPAPDIIDAARIEALALLKRGNRASAGAYCADETLTLQTLGARGHLRGVLVIGGSAKLDDVGQQVVTSVVALAGLALEQQHTLDRARNHLRTGLLRLLANGEVELVEEISREMWGPLPAEPVIAVVTAIATDRLEAVAERLEFQTAATRGRLFFAIDEGRVVLYVNAADRELVNELAEDLEVHFGVSEPQPWTGVPRALVQAQQAYEGAGGTASVADFSDLVGRGVLALLDGAAAKEVGMQVLAPLRAHDQARGGDLVGTLRAWLAQNGEYEATARALGVHRHTLRTRIAAMEELLGRDLSQFHTRAELWAALLVTPEHDASVPPPAQHA